MSSLDLSYDNLEILPDEIGELKNLRDLELSGNHLEMLPIKIGELKNLKVLNLSNNAFVTLPTSIIKLQNLTSLDLSFNLLMTLPADIDKLQNLNLLNLSYSPLTSLLVSKLKNLTSLDVRYTFMKEEQIQKIQKTIPNCSVNYSLDKNRITWSYLSHTSLLSNKPKSAIIATKKAIALEPGKSSLISHLMLAYALNNEWGKTEAICREWKDKKFVDEERPAKNVFLNDIEELEGRGIKHKNIEKIKELLK